MPRWTLSLEERFEEKIVREPNSGCWLWVGSINLKGYGQIRLAKRICVQAHRLSYEWHRGPIPAGIFVLHKCDTPACVRPDHLFLGTAADNSADMRAKGRSPAGERSGNAKLTVDAVRKIRQSSLTINELADQFAISPRTVLHIKSRTRWTNLEDSPQ